MFLIKEEQVVIPEPDSVTIFDNKLNTDNINDIDDDTKISSKKNQIMKSDFSSNKAKFTEDYEMGDSIQLLYNDIPNDKINPLEEIDEKEDKKNEIIESCLFLNH